MNNAINTLKDNGFVLKPAMSAVKNEKGAFDSLFSVWYNETEIMYVRKNEDGTFKTIEFLNYPSSFSKVMNKLNLEEMLKVLKSVVANNFR